MSNSNFITDTSSVPEGVDLVLGQQRNLIIERGRSMPHEAERALGELAALYWDHSDTASDETRFFLADARIDYAIEAGIDSARASEIWQSGRKDLEEG